eukprot:m.35425 g.35425  ORF g.35425 m.35425 type:complete len:426 (+) comp12393_c0_seq1:1128-2405(+)
MSELGKMMPILGAAFLLLSYVATKYLPPPKPRMAGIDLGTTYSCIAVYHAGSGHVEVIPDHSTGKLTIPSVVALDNHSGAILTGHAAKAQATLNPSNTVYEAKRFIGRPYQLEAVNQARYPFKVINQSGNYGFELPADPTRLTSPEEVGSHVVQRLRKSAELHLAAGITKCVMAVPAEFNQRQRNATMAAANRAGLEVLRLLTEPTAAAMAYGLHEQADERHILVFDFGGGTLDVSLLHVENGVFATMALAGDKRLGGEDLTHTLFAHVYELFKSTHPSDTSLEQQQRLRVGSEDLKLCLSTNTTCTLNTSVSETTSFKLTMTREEFETLTASVYERMLIPVHSALAQAELDTSDIAEVVLVGGSTRVPKVRSVLAQVFGKPPHSEIDPDQAVAVGVAVQAGILAGAWPLQVSAIEIPFQPDREL